MATVGAGGGLSEAVWTFAAAAIPSGPVVFREYGCDTDAALTGRPA